MTEDEDEDELHAPLKDLGLDSTFIRGAVCCNRMYSGGMYKPFPQRPLKGMGLGIPVWGSTATRRHIPKSLGGNGGRERKGVREGEKSKRRGG